MKTRFFPTLNNYSFLFVVKLHNILLDLDANVKLVVKLCLKSERSFGDFFDEIHKRHFTNRGLLAIM